MDLRADEHNLTELSAGKTVKTIRRHRENEVMIEFTDDARLYVNGAQGEQLDFAVTGGASD